MARAATSGELALFRTPQQKSRLFAAILVPQVVFRARVNQTFSTTDRVLEVTYDTPSGTLANALPDMTVLVGSTLDGHDKGICRLRSIDGSKFYIGKTSDIAWANDLYLTVINDFGLWAREIVVSDDVAFMDGGIAYTNQHTNFDPVPIMGSHRILKKIGANVSTIFSWNGSYMPDDSAISGYSTSAPTASASSGMTTSTPTITFNAVGWHPIYLTVTGANGKTFFAMRWVYVYDDNNYPASVQIGDNGQDVDSGGWRFSLTLLDNADLSLVRDRALVVVFAEDRYGNTAQSIGPLTGCENVVLTGWIGGETIQWDPEQGQVAFSCYTAHHWLQLIPAYPSGVEFTTKTPQAWTEIKNLTPRLGLFHFLHWRTTATRVMDVYLPDDDRFILECSSLAGNLWGQIQEIAWDRTFARTGVDRYNRLFIQLHPQLTPTASRTHPTVMDITVDDHMKAISFERQVVNPVSVVDMSGGSINSAGKITPYFALAPGRAFPHYGSPEIVTGHLFESQAELLTTCGLYWSWKNNPLKDIPIPLKANNRLIDCFPNQKCTITIAEEDTPRGIQYSGGLIPISVSFVHNVDSGYLYTEAHFEAETFEGLAVVGDFIGSEDVSVPPLDPLPPLPPLDFPIIPGVIEPSEDGGPPKVLLHGSAVGLVYSENFNEDASDIGWLVTNPGLTAGQYQNINWIGLTPSGGIYVASRGGVPAPFIAYAPSIGSTFTIIEDVATILAKFGGSSPHVNAIGVDPLTGNAAYVVTNSSHVGAIFVGSGTQFTQGVSLNSLQHTATNGTLSFGAGAWRYTCMMTNTVNVRFMEISADGGTILKNIGMGGQVEIEADSQHLPVSTTDAIFVRQANSLVRITQNGAVAGDFTNYLSAGQIPSPGLSFDLATACDPSGTLMMACWDASGRRGKSADGGSSFVGLPALPALPGSEYAFDFAGGGGATSRWVAGRGSTLRYSDDFGGTWGEKVTSLLNTVSFTPGIDLIKVVEY